MTSDVNRFSGHVMCLSELALSFSPVILYFGGDIGNGSLCVENSKICRHRCWFPLLHILIIADIYVLFKSLSPKAFLTISWFKKKSFSDCGERFHEIAERCYVGRWRKIFFSRNLSNTCKINASMLGKRWQPTLYNILFRYYRNLFSSEPK